LVFGLKLCVIIKKKKKRTGLRDKIFPGFFYLSGGE
jgi:hypothetical protein